MTAAQLHKMQEGRRKAAERRAKTWARDREAFLGWLKAESVAFARRHVAEIEHGRSSEEWAVSHAGWVRVLRSMPTPPPDHAWTIAA